MATLFADGDLGPAEEIARAVLLRHGDDPEAMRLLARIGMARDVLDDAETLLAAVLERVPDHAAARLDYAQCLLQRHKYAAARAELERLRANDPVDRDLRAMAAAIAVGLGDHATAIGLYRALHWDAALPGRVLRVQHEDVVDDLEGSVRQLLDGVGLPFEQACVDFHRNPRSVRTPSSEQVRQPIFRDGLEQWTRFAQQLEPLRLALGDAFMRYRPEPAR